LLRLMMRTVPAAPCLKRDDFRAHDTTRRTAEPSTALSLDRANFAKLGSDTCSRNRIAIAFTTFPCIHQQDNMALTLWWDELSSRKRS
jgi:hypothetical protein